MDPIEVRVHDETNQQTQGNLVGMSSCRGAHDQGWLLEITNHYIFGLKAQEVQLVLTPKPNNFYSIMVCAHPDDVFYFQDVGEVNEIQMPFTIGIRTPT